MSALRHFVFSFVVLLQLKRYFLCVHFNYPFTSRLPVIFFVLPNEAFCMLFFYLIFETIGSIIIYTIFLQHIDKLEERGKRSNENRTTFI